jgi:hypothetical protein
MLSRPATIGWFLALLAVGLPNNVLAEPDDVVDLPPQIPALADSYSRLPEALHFSLDDHKLPAGGHIQGLQLQSDASNDRNLLFLSHDSNTQAYFVIASIAADAANAKDNSNRVVHVQMLPSDGKQPPLRHAGGIQLAGDILAVGVEDNQAKLRSEVQFWNVADPEKPVQLSHLTIARHSERPKEMTAGAVGIVERVDDYLVAVANWDCRNIDFYQSTGKRLDAPDCRFRLLSRWDAPPPSQRPRDSSGAYQAINLFAGDDQRIYLAGFETTAGQRDVVELLAVETSDSSLEPRMLERRELKLPSGHHFRYGAGASTEGHRWRFFGSPSNLTPETTISLPR